jgi:hypothetical protein
MTYTSGQPQDCPAEATDLSYTLRVGGRLLVKEE